MEKKNTIILIPFATNGFINFKKYWFREKIIEKFVYTAIFTNM